MNNVIVENFETFDDTSVAVIQNNKLVCVTETERITKHKHAKFEHPKDELTPYILQHFDKNLQIIPWNTHIKYKSHHELHAIASFFSSGFEKSNILVVDGTGDQEDAVTLFYGRNNELYELKKYSNNVSLGILYGAASYLLYGTEHSEGKLMGLSCCSEPEYTIPSPIQFFEDGSTKTLYKLRKDNNILESIIDYIRSEFSYLFDKNGNTLKSDTYRAKIAATVQWWFTEQMKNIVKYLQKISPRTKNLCIGGGCFLNCETNGEIDRLDIFDNIYCIPAPADNGLVLGKAQQMLPSPIKISSPYLGIDYKKDFEDLKRIFRLTAHNNEIESEITSINNIEEYSDEFVVKRLLDDKIIIWFDGKSEFGPRALGHRSFLANPSNNETFWRLSVDIKQRENYRPLAPVTTDELYPLIFEDKHPHNLTQFMLKTVKIKDEWLSKIPAVVHVNKTARPQRLEKNINPELYSVIHKFYKESGIPCLINTSLNLKNQPLLETYSDLISLINNMRVSGGIASVVVDHKLCFDIM